MPTARLRISDHLGERIVALEALRWAIGSGSSNDIRLSGPEISPDHAEIVRTDDGYYLRSREQQFGTCLNGEPVSGAQRLLAGDCIRLGRGNGADLVLLSDQVVELRVALPSGDTLEHVLEGRQTTIGRSLRCDVVIPDASVSRQHAVIRWRGGQLSVEDTSDRHGVIVNGTRVAGTASIAPDDEIRLGACTATVIISRDVVLASAADTGEHLVENVRLELAIGRALETARAQQGPEALRDTLPDAFAQVEMIELRRQLGIAHAIQKVLLPRDSPAPAGYRMFGDSQPCYTVGGDFFDFIELQGGRIGLVLGDVSGKGLGAALLAHFTQASIRTALRYEPDVGDVVATVNRELCQRSLPNQFVTVCVGVLDPGRGSFQYVNAGHCPPLYVGPDAVPRFLEGGGPVLGVLPDCSYRTERLHLDAGSAVVLYSDGLTECTNVDDVEFGPDRLASFFAARAMTPPQRILQELEGYLEHFGLRGMPADDITLLLVQREAGPSPSSNN